MPCLIILFPGSDMVVKVTIVQCLDVLETIGGVENVVMADNG